jgi:anti-anti-sigma factor
VNRSSIVNLDGLRAGDDLGVVGLEVTTSVSADGISVVAVAGELDLAGTGELATSLAELRARRPQTVILDLSRCEFIDSAGFAPIHGFVSGAPRHRVAVVCDEGQVRRFFDFIKLDEVVFLSTSIQEASAALAAQAGNPAA